ncbi:hypothetical protein B0H15DRAFT_36381 [Mycena belliarum]|uniref:F-box domain-containing protein n=1 Tax=Mycena belliarum TaxID=1033014 RepID=A0AAD6UAS7_9AGAR|nr:hypothetical protein B0H15DRAFT_36381 [Mycena belliae]
MAADLPADILEILFAESQSSSADSGGDVGAAALCGLVCKAWLPASRARVFSSVTIKERNAQSFLDVAKTSALPLKSFIRMLQLTVRKGDEFFESNSIKELGPLPNATTLRMKADAEGWIPALADTFFPNNFPRLANLDLAVSDFTSISMRDILAAITPFPTLETLKLDVKGHGFNFMDDSVPDVYQIPPHWRTLVFDMEMAETFWEILFEMEEADMITIPVFSQLRMQGSWPQERSFLGRYLRGYGHKMMALSFDCSDDNMFNPPGALRYCTALHRLDLRLDTRKVPATLISVIEHIRSLSFAEINVFDPDRLTSRSLSGRQVDKWQKLDQALSEERFAGLKKLSFMIPTPGNLADKLLENMTSCAARGILRVTEMEAYIVETS